jgi:hypothetical protein
METMSEAGTHRQKLLEAEEDRHKLQEQLRFLDQRVEELTKEAMTMVPAGRVRIVWSNPISICIAAQLAN